MNEKWMQRALKLAVKGKGATSPNPCVGAVIVNKGEIIGEGWHKKAGSDHAEVLAIKSVKNKKYLKGADLYVTLEPCCHFGKTPPCTSMIIEVGIGRVFIGMKDPFLKVSGRGINILKKAKIGVELLKSSTALAEEMKELNQPFLKFVKTGLPYLTIKAGISIDGKIAVANGKSKWITGEKARNDARVERSLYDAVVVGAKTVNLDDPLLNAFGIYKKKQILKVVLDGNLGSNPKNNIFKSERVLIACTEKASKSKIAEFRKMGVQVEVLGKKEVNIKSLLKFLGKQGVQSVFVEGGSETHGSFHDASLRDGSLIDKYIFYIAPFLIGGTSSLSMIGGSGVENLNLVKKALEISCSFIDRDLKYVAILNRY